MSTKPLVIVESPSKAGTIEKYLGGEYEVLASVGHIKDLPDKELAVDIERDFHSTWIVPPRKKAVVQRLKEAAQKADAIYLATDPDREGEAIAAHVAAELPDKPHYRVRFHEITRKAVQEALAHPEEIDEHLVNAQLARRVLDRLVGYLISPQLWRTLRSWLKLDQDSGLSAGRVQSATLRLLVDRERERLRFRTARFFDLEATLQAGAKDSFTATLIQVGGKRVATGKDFDAQTGRPKSSQVVVLNETDAQALQARLLPLPWTLDRKEVQPKSVRPRPPYTTSTLQQDAARRFGSSARVMRLAQQLYEAGFISYMRT
ncbi:MAG: DNA topoisomerase I, partial [Candidatus Neomarinimicrobiota bacterium]